MRSLSMIAFIATTLVPPTTPPALQAPSNETGPAPAAQANPATPNQLAIVRYFRDVLDAGTVELVRELFHPDCTIHRPEGDFEGLEALTGGVLARRALYSSFVTEIHDIVESGDRVVVRLTHRAVGAGALTFRVGTYDVTGRTLGWDAIAIFRMKDAKVAEEWVNRDELGMLLTGGVVPTAVNTYPTMLDMTFPEFEAAVKKTDIVLVPIGSVEEHNAHLPLGTDAINATAQMSAVQHYLRNLDIETILGPPLNIGITNEAGDWVRDGTYAYPGSLTISKRTFVALYVDVLRSLHDNGLRRAFLHVGHLGGRQVEAVVEAVEAANRSIEGMTICAVIPSEVLERMKLEPNSHILSVEKGRNFEMLAQLLGRGTELARTTHAEGAETSWTLYFHPEVVRPGYRTFPQTPSSVFLDVLNSGERSKNPTGSGGFPFDKATATVGRQIADDRTARIANAILQVVPRK